MLRKVSMIDVISSFEIVFEINQQSYQHTDQNVTAMASRINFNFLYLRVSKINTLASIYIQNLDLLPQLLTNVSSENEFQCLNGYKATNSRRV